MSFKSDRSESVWWVFICGSMNMFSCLLNKDRITSVLVTFSWTAVDLLSCRDDLSVLLQISSTRRSSSATHICQCSFQSLIFVFFLSTQTCLFAQQLSMCHASSVRDNVSCILSVTQTNDISVRCVDKCNVCKDPVTCDRRQVKTNVYSFSVTPLTLIMCSFESRSYLSTNLTKFISIFLFHSCLQQSFQGLRLVSITKSSLDG